MECYFFYNNFLILSLAFVCLLYIIVPTILFPIGI